MKKPKPVKSKLRHYVVDVTAFSTVLVMDAESEEQAYEFARDEFGISDFEIDEMKISEVIEPSDEEALARAERHANITAHP